MSLTDRATQPVGVTPVTVGRPDEAATAPTPRPAANAAPVPTPSIDIPESYGKVVELVQAGCPLVFVSGNAGTGKTTLIRYLNGILPLRTVIVAPTGVAALNAGGVTIHSFFQFPPRIQDPREIRLLADRKLIQKLQLLVVDEVSMLRCDVLDSMDVFLRKNRETQEPFGRAGQDPGRFRLRRLRQWSGLRCSQPCSFARRDPACSSAPSHGREVRSGDPSLLPSPGRDELVRGERYLILVHQTSFDLPAYILVGR